MQRTFLVTIRMDVYVLGSMNHFTLTPTLVLRYRHFARTVCRPKGRAPIDPSRTSPIVLHLCRSHSLWAAFYGICASHAVLTEELADDFSSPLQLNPSGNQHTHAITYTHMHTHKRERTKTLRICTQIYNVRNRCRYRPVPIHADARAHTHTHPHTHTHTELHRKHIHTSEIHRHIHRHYYSPPATCSKNLILSDNCC